MTQSFAALFRTIGVLLFFDNTFCMLVNLVYFVATIFYLAFTFLFMSQFLMCLLLPKVLLPCANEYEELKNIFLTFHFRLSKKIRFILMALNC